MLNRSIMKYPPHANAVTIKVFPTTKFIQLLFNDKLASHYMCVKCMIGRKQELWV